MKEGSRKDPYQVRQTPVMAWVFRLVVLFVGMTGCLTAVLVVYGRWQEARQLPVVLVEGGNPRLNPAERIYLQTYLSNHAADLQQPIGRGIELIDFTIEPGQTAEAISANLMAVGLLHDGELFLNYVLYYGLDAQLEAGDFRLDPQLTIPELALALTQVVALDVTLQFLEGWRLEEVGNYLATVTPANIQADDFLAIAQRQTPFDLSRYDFLASLPPDASLEGFLFPDTYTVPIDANAAYLVSLMLQNFGERLTPALRQSIQTHDVSLYEGVILASIVEREAVVTSERPLIANVFYNRLAQAMPLQADPTIQYALGYQAATNSWWKSPLSVADLRFDSPYNTYLIDSLPPGPIANPGLASLEAVARPATTDYLFFVADCTTAVAGTHLFSVTYEEHLANVQRCR